MLSHQIALFALTASVWLFSPEHTQAGTSPARRRFEVASIKLNRNCESSSRLPRLSPGRIHLPCCSVRSLIRVAYGGFTGETLNSSRLQVLSGPAWLDTERYDISANADETATVPQMMGPMLQTLLEERFSIKVHRERKESPVYALTIAKSGSKLQPSKKDGSCTPMALHTPANTTTKPGEPTDKYCGSGRMSVNEGNLVTDWHAVTMPEFAGRMLSSYLDRPVIDQTGLTGRFEIHLEFARNELGSRARRLNGVDAPGLATYSLDNATGPSIFTIVNQQLGLRLSPTTGSVEVLVIDRVDRPSPN